MPKDKRPRERLIRYGGQNVTDLELIATLLGTGSAKKDVLSLAKTLIQAYPLAKLAGASIPDLLSIPGIGQTKATRIAAALELGNRIFSPSLTKTTIQTTQDALNQLKEFAGKKQEFLVALFLNARDELIEKQIITQGSLNTNFVEPRDILSLALSLPCASFIIAHNHPSNDPTPSKADIQFTVRLQKAAEILGIELKDHLIICESNYFSVSNLKLRI